MQPIHRRRVVSFLVLLAVVIGQLISTSTPAQAKNNSVILKGADWLSGSGVDVYSNDGDYNSAYNDYNSIAIDGKTYRTGLRWQCVEMVYRLYLSLGWIPRPANPSSFSWNVPTGAYQMFESAPSNLSKSPNGAIYTVNPGDVIVQGGGWGGYGHVSVVMSVTGNTITTANQNVHTSQAIRTYSRAANSITPWAGYSLIGVVHAPMNSTQPSGPPQPAPTGAGPTKNGGFNQNTAYWTASGSANLAHNAAGGQGSGTNPYEGSGFAVSNASQAGDSIHQTTAAPISTHDSFCVSARMVTVGANPGSSGTLALWLLGPTNDVSTVAYENLPGSNGWQEITTCVMATGSRSHIKVQLYPTQSSPTVGIDAVDVRKTLNVSSGFNNGNSYWNLQPNTNLATYTAAHNTGNRPYEGLAFAATNTSQPGGGFSQDMPRNIAPGDTFCAEAQVVTVGEIAGASGALAIHLTGTTATEQSTYHFNNLSAGNAWRHVKACATATTPHSNVRVQVYPSANGATLGVDALDVLASIALNGGFNGSAGHWSANGSLGYATFANFGGTSPYEGSAFEIVQTNTANSSLSQTRAYGWGTGDTFCTEAAVVSGGSTPGAGGTLAIWLMGTTTDVSTYSFSALPAGNAWSRIKACAMANSNTSSGVIKVEIYPSTNNLPLAIDAVDVH